MNDSTEVMQNGIGRSTTANDNGTVITIRSASVPANSEG